MNGIEKESMGAFAVIRLVDRIDKKGVGSAIKIQVKTKLVKRDSVLKRVPEFEIKANDIAHSI